LNAPESRPEGKPQPFLAGSPSFRPRRAALPASDGSPLTDVARPPSGRLGPADDGTYENAAAPEREDEDRIGDCEECGGTARARHDEAHRRTDRGEKRHRGDAAACRACQRPRPQCAVAHEPQSEQRAAKGRSRSDQCGRKHEPDRRRPARRPRTPEVQAAPNVRPMSRQAGDATRTARCERGLDAPGQTGKRREDRDAVDREDRRGEPDGAEPVRAAKERDQLAQACGPKATGAATTRTRLRRSGRR